MNASGVLGAMAPFAHPFVLNFTPTGEWLGYIPTFSADGAEIDMQFAQPSFNGQPQTGSFLYLYGCGSNNACSSEFLPQTINFMYSVELQTQVSAVSVATLEPGSLALLATGIAAIGLKRRKGIRLTFNSKIRTRFATSRQPLTRPSLARRS